jgi:hypothetical protein
VPEQLEQAPPDDSPPVDPTAVHQAYRFHRARRRARIERRQRQRRASVRFWVVFVLLAAASLFIALTTWREVARLFGF